MNSGDGFASVMIAGRCCPATATCFDRYAVNIAESCSVILLSNRGFTSDLYLSPFFPCVLVISAHSLGLHSVVRPSQLLWLTSASVRRFVERLRIAGMAHTRAHEQCVKRQAVLLLRRLSDNSLAIPLLSLKINLPTFFPDSERQQSVNRSS